MSFEENINQYWKYLEKKYSTPRYVTKVKMLEFNDLKKAIDNKNENYLKKIIKSMYVNKEAYILKNSATKTLKETIISLANHYKRTKKTNFGSLYQRIYSHSYWDYYFCGIVLVL